MNLITNNSYRELDLDKHIMKDLVGFRSSRKEAIDWRERVM